MNDTRLSKGKPSLSLHIFLMCTYAIPSMALAGAGVLLCATIVGIPPGVMLILLSGLPIALESNRYNKKKDAWKAKQMGSEKFRTGRGKAGTPNKALLDDLEYEYDPVTDSMVVREKPWNLN